jgi:hypothetical protein
VTVLELQCRQVLTRRDEDDWRYSDTLRYELIAEIESRVRTKLNVNDEAGRRSVSVTEKFFR